MTPSTEKEGTILLEANDDDGYIDDGTIPFKGKFKAVPYVAKTPAHVVRSCRKVQYLSRSYNNVILQVALENALPFDVVEELNLEESIGLEDVIREVIQKCNSPEQLEAEERRILSFRPNSSFSVTTNVLKWFAMLRSTTKDAYIRVIGSGERHGAWEVLSILPYEELSTIMCSVQCSKEPGLIEPSWRTVKHGANLC